MITKIIQTETIIVAIRTVFRCDTLDEAKAMYKYLRSQGYSVMSLTERDQFGNNIYNLFL